MKTLSRPDAGLGGVHRHIEHRGQYVEIHRRSGQTASHVAAGVELTRFRGQIGQDLEQTLVRYVALCSYQL